MSSSKPIAPDTLANRSKLDPTLAHLLEQAAPANTQVEVMLALDAAASPELLAELAKRGFSLRGQTGDILTGALRLDALDAVAAEPRVRVIEGSRALSAEAPDSPSTEASEPPPFG